MNDPAQKPILIVGGTGKTGRRIAGRGIWEVSK